MREDGKAPRAGRAALNEGKEEKKKRERKKTRSGQAGRVPLYRNAPQRAGNGCETRRGLPGTVRCAAVSVRGWGQRARRWEPEGEMKETGLLCTGRAFCLCWFGEKSC